MGMKTLLIGLSTLIIFFVGFSFLLFNQLVISITIMMIAVLIGALGWVVVWFGNDMSLLFSKLKFFKTGTKSLNLYKDRSNKYHFLFTDANSKVLKVSVKTVQGRQVEPITIGKSDGTIAGTSIAVHLGREGVHQTFGMDDKINLGLEGSYIANLFDEAEALGRKGTLQKKPGFDITMILLILVLAAAIVGAFMAFNASNQIGVLQGAVDALKPPITQAITDSNTAAVVGGSIIEGIP